MFLNNLLGEAIQPILFLEYTHFWKFKSKIKNVACGSNLHIRSWIKFS